MGEWNTNITVLQWSVSSVSVEVTGSGPTTALQFAAKINFVAIYSLLCET